MKKYSLLKKIVARISQLQYVQRILMWDEASMMPEGAGRARALAVATLNRTIHRMLISKKVSSLITEAKQQDDLSEWDSVNLELITKKYNKAACIPASLTEKATRAAMACEQAWRKMRPQNNWVDFLPYFQESFKFIQEIATRQAQVLQLNKYDALLDTYASGFKQDDIDPLFLKLKQILPPLLQKIEQQQKESLPLLKGPFAIEKQKNLGLTVMRALQFDFNRGRLDVSDHPFCSGGPSDVRITTRYSANEFMSSFLGICHETGHALYEQGLPSAWLDQPIGHVDNMVMHESQSLLIEMDVSRSLAFMKYLTPLIQQEFGEHPSLTPANLYQNAIKVQPSFIRVDADEVTYPLHIILRYELEKALINNEIELKDLPAAWNELMIRYLGLSTLDNDKQGVMQDVHWPCGALGYFPAYTLGRLMAAQLFKQYAKIHPQLNDDFKYGQFQHLVSWLNENIHSLGSSLSANDLLIKVTGEKLNPQFFIEHLHQRYLYKNSSDIH